MQDDLAGALFDHGREHHAAGVGDADQVGFEVSFHALGLLARNGPIGPLHGGGGDQDVEAAEHGAHALDGVRHLVGIADIGAQAHGGAAGLFDFQFGQIDFRLAARQQADARALGGESHRQTLADAAARPGDQNALSFNVVKDQFSTVAVKIPVRIRPPRFICTKMR